MNKFLKALLISLVLYASHILFLYILVDIAGNEDSQNSYFKSVIAAAIYIFIFAFWTYYLLSLIYVALTRNNNVIRFKISIAVLLMTIGYVMYRTGDIMDGDFIKHFQIGPFISFVLSPVIIVVVDQKLDKAHSKHKSLDE